jgi:murein DD-endopeptidase MepM/ murein hydrolase activator NlpD
MLWTDPATGASSSSQTIGLSASTGLVGSAAGGIDKLIVDDGALVSESGPLGTLGDLAETPTASGISIYVVREGDTLSQIAGMFGVSVNTIIWANDLPSAKAIHEGQTLVILPISGVQHVVAKGETIESIAKKYKGDVKEIVQYNGLEPNAKLAIGDILIIPDGEAAQPVPRSVASGKTRTPSVSYDGYYLRPIQGGVRTQGLHGYNAVDLATFEGAPVLAAAGGRVVVSRTGGWNGGYGNYIVIEHPNGTQTLYAHNRENIVFVGQKVVPGQVIGYVGSTGRTTGPHVHFEVRGAKNPF